MRLQLEGCQAATWPGPGAAAYAEAAAPLGCAGSRSRAPGAPRSLKDGSWLGMCGLGGEGDAAYAHKGCGGDCTGPADTLAAQISKY